MRVRILFSSGTGNTKFIAEEVAKVLEAQGHAVVSTSLEAGEPVDSCELLIVGGPICAGNVPEKLIRAVLRTVPQASGTKAAVFTTSAGLANAHGVRSLGLKLQKKGYQVVGSQCFVMPRNYYFGHYQPMEKAYCRELIVQAQGQVKAWAETLSTAQTPLPFEAKGVLGLDLMAELFSVMAKFMGKSFRANENCTLCQKCVRECPQKNISVRQDRIHFALDCMMCTRCIHGCPAHAIEYNKETYPQYRLRDSFDPPGVSP